MGWWQLLDGFTDYKCGRGAASRGRDDRSRDAGTAANRHRRDWSDACEAWYAATLEAVVDGLLDAPGRLGVYRTSSCCGKEIDDVRDAWRPSLERQNAAAARVMGDRGVPVVDVWSLYGADDLDAHTFDGLHANVAMCHTWNTMVFRALDARAGMTRSGNGGGASIGSLFVRGIDRERSEI